MNRVHAVRRRSVTVAVVTLAAGALLASPAARAEFPFPPSPRELHHEVRSVVHDVLRTLERIPMEIHREHMQDLAYFLSGDSYYGPHHHNHATYNFPVWIDGEVYYRPYSYCNGRLYGSYASRPQFWSGWGVESQGHWCSSHRSYYPTSHSCFRHSSGPRYRSQYGGHSGAQYRNYDRNYDRTYSGSHSGQGYRSRSGSDYRPEYRPQSRPHYRSPQYSQPAPRAQRGAQYQQQYREQYRPQVRQQHQRQDQQQYRPQSRSHRSENGDRQRSENQQRKQRKGHTDRGHDHH